MYSALKVNGKKLYEIARSGGEIERRPRKIEIFNIGLLNYDSIENEIEYKVTCSKGTYIRVLSEDIAKKNEYMWIYVVFKKNKSWKFQN